MLHGFQCKEKSVNHAILSPPSTNTGSTNTTDQRLSNQPLQSSLIAKPHTILELGTVIDYPFPNPMQSQNYKSSFIGQPHAIPELQIMPNPMPALETDTVPVPTLSPFSPDSDSPSRETRVEGYNPEEHGELSHKELIELFGEENMNCIFELSARQTALTVSHPSPDRREATVITTSARKSKYKSTENDGMRQPSRPKKQTIGVGKHVFVERKYLKYMFDPTSEAFSIIELNSSDKFKFFGSVVGKAIRLYHVKLDLLPSSANEVSISRSSIEVL